MKKIIVIIAVLIFTTVDVMAISAKSAICIDADTGEVFYEKNADETLPMASTTKIMTALLALETLSPDEIIKILPEYTGIEGSSMYLKAGEEIKVKDLIYGLMLMSGNDAAVALAYECSGSVEEFVDDMNERALEMGLTSTSFETPNGLDGESHYTTASELAIITMEAMKNEDFREIVSSESYSTDGRTMQNHNKMLWLYDDAIGVKTGYTKKSGRCLVSAAQRNGRTIIAVTLNAGDDWNDHLYMLEEGFLKYQQFNITQIYENNLSVPVISGESTYAQLFDLPENEIYLTENEINSMKYEIFAEKFEYAPIFIGDVYGIIKFKAFDKVYAEYPLVMKSDILEKVPEEKSIYEKIIGFFIDLV